MQYLHGKIILVTGGSRGIGKAIAQECAKRGGHVIINFQSNKKAASQVVREIEDNGGSAELLQADISQLDQINTLFDTIKSKFGGFDILVNNAGIMINTPVQEVSEEEFDRTFNINVKGLFFCCQHACKIMHRGGRIINIGTTVTKVMLPNYGTYAASKGAVEQLTRVLAKELGKRHITVNTLSPGPTDTDLFRTGKSGEQIDGMAAMSAFNRIGTPADISKAVAMLAGPDGDWISGQTIFVNGGFI